jgi:two-component system, sensor histidine kinase YesM
MSYGIIKDNMLKKAPNHKSTSGNRLQRSINNRKIRSKTFYLYVFCVLIPVLVTNMFVIGNAVKASFDERKSNINNIVDSVSHDISSSLESGANLTVYVYASNSICKFLDDQYESDGEFFTAYNRVFENYVFYASSKNIINDLTLYSDNQTMINGGRYNRIDSIRSQDWYQKFIKADVDLFVYPYYNHSIYKNHENRMFTIIRKLNYNELSNIEKIVKLDINYNKVKEAIKISAFDTTVFVCHNDKIIFSNDTKDKGIKDDFENVSKIPQGEVQLNKSYSAYGFDYDIYLTGYESNYFAMLRENLWMIAILFLADALIPAIILALFSSSITKRILLLGKYMKKVKGEEFELLPESEGKDEIGELLDNYNLMVVRMKYLIEYEYKSKLEQQELYLARQQAELLALYSQINPHFMFNVLESIRMHSVIKNECETSQMIESLAKLMRKSAQWGSDLITIEQELGFTEDYLNLQKYRFGDDFNYKFRISKDCYNHLIPSLVLVTFVENSCVHGLNREGHFGTIFVSVYEEDSFLYIEVEDTGIGMEEEQVKKLEKSLNEANIDDLQNSSSLGMLNACIRLKKYCGSQTRIILESEKLVGTCIIIKIPIENMKSDL